MSSPVIINPAITIGTVVFEINPENYDWALVPVRKTYRTRMGKLYQVGIKDGTNWKTYHTHTISGFSDQQFYEIEDLFKVADELTFIDLNGRVSTVCLVDTFDVNEKGARARYPSWVIELEDVG